jgi:chromosome segregation ATPase
MNTSGTAKAAAVQITALDVCAIPAARPAGATLPPVSGPESGVRAAALNLQILELDHQLAVLQDTIATERAMSHAVESNAATVADRMTALETELRACTDARDTAGAVAAAAVAELREVRAVCAAMRRDLEAARAERDAAAAAATSARSRISELETALANARTSRGENIENVRILPHRLQN